MKLEVGEYIRFKDKRGIEYVRKIAKLPDDTRYAGIYIDKPANNVTGVSPKNVLNHDFNKIELIEVGDVILVDNIKYTVLQNKNIFNNKLYINRDSRITTLECLFERNQIQSIVTKEQFKSCEYNFEEE